MTPEKKRLLEIKGLKTQFHLLEGSVTALDEIDLTINENESIGIVGETGCGKSMTAFSILRLVPHPGKIESGNVFYMEPPEVRSRRLEIEAEAQSLYKSQPNKKKLEIVTKYGPRRMTKERRAGTAKTMGRKTKGQPAKGEVAKVAPPAKAQAEPAKVSLATRFKTLFAKRDTKRAVKERKVPQAPTAAIAEPLAPEKAPNGFVMEYLAKKAKSIPESDKVGRDAATRHYDLLMRSPEEMRRFRGKQISMIFQDPSTSLDPVFTVGSQLAEVISLHQKITDDAMLKRKVIEALSLVRIAAPESVVKQYPHELSGGMKQRVMIALALSCNPKMLIADEPTTALDVTIQAQILNLLKDLVIRSGSSMMLITHNLGVVAETCDRVCIMYAGRIVEDAETFSLFGKPMHPYTRGLLTAFPKLGEKKEELAVIRGTVPDLMKPFKGCSFADRCNQASEVCRKVRPEMIEVEPEHFVSCHLYPKGVA